ncbi:MAG: hypothetical protein EOO57_14980 [Hymenobacter sp.]|nr:MAG: hypothetical protein EOO57_14980 [Hymenobacter sp.]
MKNSLLLFVGAALSLASCSQEKTAETTTTTTPTDGSAMTMPDTAAYRTRANRVSEKFITDMKITDPAMQGKIRTAYYNRSKRYGEMKSKYGSDTTGMAAAMRQYNTDTDTEFQGVLTDQTQYQSYQSSRSNYDESNYMDDASSSTTMPADNSSSNSSSMSSSSAPDMSNGVGIEKSKTKLEDGSQMKIKDDGTVTTKDANGNKGVPINSDADLKYSKTKLDDGSKVKVKGDGTVKVKDADGTKTKL